MTAPLQVTVEIQLESGPAAGQRRFRLSRQIDLPPALHFDRELPLVGQGHGRVTFVLPNGTTIEASATLFSDPEHPEQGSTAELLDLEPAALEDVQSYITQRIRM